MRVLSELEPKNVFSFFEIYVISHIHHIRKRKSAIILLISLRKESLNIIRIHLTM